MIGELVPAEGSPMDRSHRPVMSHVLLTGLLACAALLLVPNRVPGQVPALGVKTRVASSGQLEIAHVRRDATHAPWVPFEMRGVAWGWTPQCENPLVRDPLEILVEEVEVGRRLR